MCPLRCQIRLNQGLVKSVMSLQTPFTSRFWFPWRCEDSGLGVNNDPGIKWNVMWCLYGVGGWSTSWQSLPMLSTWYHGRWLLRFKGSGSSILPTFFKPVWKKVVNLGPNSKEIPCVSSPPDSPLEKAPYLMFGLELAPGRPVTIEAVTTFSSIHVNLLRWHNLIGSLSQDIGRYPMIENSTSGYCFLARVTVVSSR